MSLLAALALAAALTAPPAAPAPPGTAPAGAPSSAAAATPTPAAPATDPLALLKPLLGEWAGDPTGRPGEALRSVATFALELDGRVLVRRHHVEFPPKPGEAAGAVHDDLLVAWSEAEGLKASYFDNEGHVIQYRVTAAGGRVTFESTAAGPGPRFRLEYAPQGDGWAVTFSIAPPGGEYRAYQSGTMHRRAR